MPEKKATVTKKSQPQRQRFIETAKQLEVDESGAEFDKAFKKIVPPKTPTAKTQK
jgi:hypothetical protein